MAVYVNDVVTAIQKDSSPWQRVSMGSALLALILFLLPWAEVSCMGGKRAMSGFDLASNGSAALWLVPLAMIAALVILYRLTIARPKTPETPALLNMVIGAGAIGAMTMVLTYLSAIAELKKDPVLGGMADTMINVRLPGVLTLIATAMTSVGCVVHQMNRQTTADPPALADELTMLSGTVTPADRSTTGSSQ